MIPGSVPGGIYHFPSQAHGVTIPAGIQDRDRNCSASYSSCQGRDREPHSAVTAQGKSLLCSTGISMLTPETGPCICLFLCKNCFAAYCLLTSHLWSPQPLRPGRHQVLSMWKLVMLHQLRLMFWIFWLQEIFI